ncbi:HdeD family acid-resistance protein [Patescibacteria group bacterium]
MLRTLSDHWWLVVLRGIVGLIFGIALIAWPAKTAVVVIALIGLLLLVDGIIMSVLALFSIRKNDHWWLILLQGALSLIIGVVIFNYPQATVAILFFLFALWLILMGIFMIVTAIIVRHETEMEWFVIASGVVSLILGVLVINNPYASFTLMAVLSGLYALVTGILMTSFGFKLKTVRNRLPMQTEMV